MKLSWTQHAVGDRDAIMVHIAKDNVVSAVAIDEQIVRAVETLHMFPEIGRLGRVPATRELVVARSNYLVVYKHFAENNEIIILRVIHGAQNWPEAFD